MKLLLKIVVRLNSLWKTPIVSNTVILSGITLMLATGDIEDTINELSSDIERREWKKTKATAIRLRYLEGIERAAKKWIDNNT
jgi:HSCB C-terminal oligomerisation domain